jgi:transcriptional regulator with XRE-family HTH domain
MNAGEQIKALRDERGLRAAEIERHSQRLADRLGNPDYVVPHATLNGIENGSIPTIYKLASLAFLLDIPLENLLGLYGIDISKQRDQAELEMREVGTHLEFRRPATVSLPPKAAPGVFTETQIVQREDPAWDLLPQGLSERLAKPERFSYGIIGAREDILGEVLPAGSFVEIDRDQNKVVRFPWKSILERPIYCLWHGEGHVCCWCEQTGNSLTIVPHPLSRQRSRQLRVPRDVNVIGRVINFWRLLNSQI